MKGIFIISWNRFTSSDRWGFNRLTVRIFIFWWARFGGKVHIYMWVLLLSTRHPFSLSLIVCSGRLKRYVHTCTGARFVSLNLVFRLSSLPNVSFTYTPILHVSFHECSCCFLYNIPRKPLRLLRDCSTRLTCKPVWAEAHDFKCEANQLPLVFR